MCTNTNGRFYEVNHWRSRVSKTSNRDKNKRSVEQLQTIWFYDFGTNSKGHTGTSTLVCRGVTTQQQLNQRHYSANVSLMRNLTAKARGRGGKEKEKQRGSIFYSLRSIVDGHSQFTSFHDTAAALALNPPDK